MPFPNPDTQFPPGQSGNPAGYSRARRQIDDFLDMLAENPDLERAISKAWAKHILKGSGAHLAQYLNRRDGKVPDVVTMQDGETQQLKPRYELPPEPPKRRSRRKAGPEAPPPHEGGDAAP